MSDRLNAERDRRSGDPISACWLRDMQNICRVPKGFLVRMRRPTGHTTQNYFGYGKWGGEHAALVAAVKRRNELRDEMGPARHPGRRYSNRNNRSGLIGVSWRVISKGKGEYSQAFRAQSAVKGSPGQPATRSFSVNRFGLWGAYCKAARWRSDALAEPGALSEAAIAERFLVYLHYCREEMAEYPDRAFSLRRALEKVIADGAAPDEVKDEIRTLLSR